MENKKILIIILSIIGNITIIYFPYKLLVTSIGNNEINSFNPAVYIILLLGIILITLASAALWFYYTISCHKMAIKIKESESALKQQLIFDDTAKMKMEIEKKKENYILFQQIYDMAKKDLKESAENEKQENVSDERLFNYFDLLLKKYTQLCNDETK